MLLAVALFASWSPGAGAFSRAEALAMGDMSAARSLIGALAEAFGGSAPPPFGAGVEVRWPMGESRWRESAGPLLEVPVGVSWAVTPRFTLNSELYLWVAFADGLRAGPAGLGAALGVAL